MPEPGQARWIRLVNTTTYGAAIQKCAPPATHAQHTHRPASALAGCRAWRRAQGVQQEPVEAPERGGRQRAAQCALFTPRLAPRFPGRGLSGRAWPWQHAGTCCSCPACARTRRMQARNMLLLGCRKATVNRVSAMLAQPPSQNAVPSAVVAAFPAIGGLPADSPVDMTQEVLALAAPGVLRNCPWHPAHDITIANFITASGTALACSTVRLGAPTVHLCAVPHRQLLEWRLSWPAGEPCAPCSRAELMPLAGLQGSPGSTAAARLWTPSCGGCSSSTCWASLSASLRWPTQTVRHQSDAPGRPAGEPWEYCSRSALDAQLRRLQQRHGLVLRVGTELEFTLLRAVPGTGPVAYEGIDESGPGDGMALDAAAHGAHPPNAGHQSRASWPAACLPGARTFCNDEKPACRTRCRAAALGCPGHRRVWHRRRPGSGRCSAWCRRLASNLHPEFWPAARTIQRPQEAGGSPCPDPDPACQSIGPRSAPRVQCWTRW